MEKIKTKITLTSCKGGIKTEKTGDKWINPGINVENIAEISNWRGKEAIIDIVGDIYTFVELVELEKNDGLKVKEYRELKEYDYYEISKVECHLDKKGMFNYVSWSRAWDNLKKLYPTSKLKVKENEQGSPLFKVGTGGAVFVEVIVREISHGIWMPVLDFKHKSIKYEEIDSFQTNTAIQRGTAKAIALHGLGLYVFHGEDLPEEGGKDGN